MHTDHISSSAILSHVYASLLGALCTSTQVKEMASQMKPEFWSDEFQVPCEIAKKQCSVSYNTFLYNLMQICIKMLTVNPAYKQGFINRYYGITHTT